MLHILLVQQQKVISTENVFLMLFHRDLVIFYKLHIHIVIINVKCNPRDLV